MNDTPVDPAAGLIHLRVRELTQLFNSLDPSPFIERDLDDDAADYIVSWAREIPLDQPLRLRVEVAEYRLLGDPQVILEAAVRTYFGWKAQLARNQYHELLRRGRLSLAIGLAALSTATALSASLSQLPGAAFARLFQEVILIGGWVAMWRPMEIFLYDWWPLLAEQRRYERLRDMTVEVELHPF